MCCSQSISLPGESESLKSKPFIHSHCKQEGVGSTSTEQSGGAQSGAEHNAWGQLKETAEDKREVFIEKKKQRGQNLPVHQAFSIKRYKAPHPRPNSRVN